MAQPVGMVTVGSYSAIVEPRAAPGIPLLAMLVVVGPLDARLAWWWH
jgi:hypothetical protein